MKSTIKSRVNNIVEVEYLIQKVQTFSGLLLIAVVYRPPLGESLDDFLSVLHDASASVDDIVVTGDINYHFERPDRNTSNLKTIFRENSLQLVDSGASYYRVNPPSWLDVFLVDDLNKVVDCCSSGQSYISGYDYGCIFYKFTFISAVHCFQFRGAKAFNHLQFQQDIIVSVRNAKHLLFSDGIDPSVDNFTLSLAKVLDKHLPLKTYRSRRPSTSYISDELKLLMKERDKLYPKFLRTRDFSLLSRYRTAWSAIVKQKRKVRSDYYVGVFSKITDSREF